MFNKETEYALRGLVYIWSQNLQGKKPGVEEISIEADAPKYYMGKILQRLVKQKVLHSIKGKGGGFYLSEEQSKISLKDLVKITEGSIIHEKCGFGLKYCTPESPCPLHNRYAPIRAQIDELLSTETIATLATNYSNHTIDYLI